MFESSVTEDLGLKWVTLKGRIDAMSTAEIQKEFNALTLTGERTMVVDFTEVNYISSAGLRVFLSVQKQLKRVGGEIILLGLAPQVMNIFNISGLDQVFCIVSTKDEIIASLQAETPHPEVFSTEVEGIAIKYITHQVDKGSVYVIGSQDKLTQAGYSEKDVLALSPTDMQFGTGLATSGEKYQDYKHLFGESMIINRNFFFYPAVKRPAVDFILDTHGDPALTYKFFHGFGFNGSYRYILSFEGKDGFVELAFLVKALFRISSANVLGIAILAESKGVWGMHLKRVPTVEQKPNNGKDIFDPENFSDWIDFPVEPADINHIIAGTGIAIKDRSLERPEIRALISEGNDFHIHTGIFEKGPLSKKLGDFDRELTRVLTELEVYKVQHILGQSQFKSGMVGIIELQG